MHFAAPLPWWLALVVAAAVASLGGSPTRRPPVPLTLIQRGVLRAWRARTLGGVVVFLCRPIVMAPPPAAGGIVVPILVDDSRSMRVADADGRSRIARAADLLTRDLLPALSAQFTPEIYTIGDAVTPASPDRLAADERRSDLTGALAAIRERYRGRRVSGIVVLSDGGETNGSEPREGETPGPPVFTIGIGSPEGPADREILSVTAGDPRLDQTAVDLHVSALSARFGRAPFTLRLLANGRLLESRSVAPVADGSPVEGIFTVAPDPLSATVYTAEIAAGPHEADLEDNKRTVPVSPAGRKLRILMLAGASGHDDRVM